MVWKQEIMIKRDLQDLPTTFPVANVWYQYFEHEQSSYYDYNPPSHNQHPISHSSDIAVSRGGSSAKVHW